MLTAGLQIFLISAPNVVAAAFDFRDHPGLPLIFVGGLVIIYYSLKKKRDQQKRDRKSQTKKSEKDRLI